MYTRAQSFPQVYVPSIRFNEVIFVHIDFCAASAAGMTSGGPSGKNFLLFQTSVHYLLGCLGFIWYLLVVVPMLPILQHGVCKDSPNFVTMHTPRPGGQGYMLAWLKDLLSV
jgi:hypothetical protein